MNHKGWHSRGYLPHFDSAEVLQFVTFRLADSLPANVVAALAARSKQLAETNEQLDRGLGTCWLKKPAIASAVETTLLHFDGERYRVLSWCIMPNHVHVVIEVLAGNQLGSIVRSWKSFAASQANQILGRSGAFWHRDYFDRFIRDEGHFERTIEYVENNPVKAGLVRSAGDWPWGSARLRA